MISALDQINSVVRCIESGAEDYLSKPFDPVLLARPASARQSGKEAAAGRAETQASPSSRPLSARLKRSAANPNPCCGTSCRRRSPEELRGRGQVEPRYFEDVTILFSDFVGFDARHREPPGGRRTW